MIDVVGDDKDEIYIAIRNFIESLGHLYRMGPEEANKLDKV